MKRSKSMFADYQQQISETMLCLVASMSFALVFILRIPLLITNPYKKFVKWLENTIASAMETL